MLIAHYVGDHANDAFSVRAGCALTRLVQKGEYGGVTHTEAVLVNHDFGVADIASSSLRDGGVRIKERVQMRPGNWLISDVPFWRADFSRDWFVAHRGCKYDRRGAWATVMPGHHQEGCYFCSHSVGASVGLREAFTFTPAHFAAICFTFGRDVTAEFFS